MLKVISINCDHMYLDLRNVRMAAIARKSEPDYRPLHFFVSVIL